jgi:hypothetical protein
MGAASAHRLLLSVHPNAAPRASRGKEITMFHTPAHKATVATPAQFAEQTLWMNVYRAGWFHRADKPVTLNIHAGDFYASKDTALAAIDPPAAYVATVPFTYTGPIQRENAPDSIPQPISATRRLFA